MWTNTIRHHLVRLGYEIDYFHLVKMSVCVCVCVRARTCMRAQVHTRVLSNSLRPPFALCRDRLSHRPVFILWVSENLFHISAFIFQMTGTCTTLTSSASSVPSRKLQKCLPLVMREPPGAAPRPGPRIGCVALYLAGRVTLRMQITLGGRNVAPDP